jgi:prevent-host-death family protein
MLFSCAALPDGPKWPKVSGDSAGGFMRSMSAKDAKYGFGRLIDTARAEPVTVEKHGRAVVVVLSIEEYERLRAIDADRCGNMSIQRKETKRGRNGQASAQG